MEAFFELAGLVFTIKDLAVVAISAAIFLVTIILFLRLTMRKAWRFFSNVQKPILFLNLTSEAKGMEFEAQMAEKTGFLARPTISHDPRQAELIDKNSLIVLGVNDTSDVEAFTSVYNLIKNKNKPVILYTLGERDTVFLRTSPQEGLVKSYSLHTISTTPLRLISDIFATLSVHKC